MGPEVIVGYLVAQLVGAGRRFADAQVDALLNALYTTVRRRLGADDSLMALQEAPLDEGAQRGAKTAVARVAEADAKFREELADLQKQLDARGAQELLLHAPGAETVIGLNYGVVVREGIVHVDQRQRDLLDLSGDPLWVKLTFALGIALGLVGFLLFGYHLFTSDLSATPAGTPPRDLAAAGAVFFVGLVLSALSQVGHSVIGPSHTPRAGTAGTRDTPPAARSKILFGLGHTRRGEENRQPSAAGRRRSFVVSLAWGTLGLVLGTLLGTAVASSGGLGEIGPRIGGVDMGQGVAGVVIESGLNLRAQPNGDIIGTVGRDEAVVVACLSGNWARLLQPHADVYVWAEGLRLDESPPAC